MVRSFKRKRSFSDAYLAKRKVRRIIRRKRSRFQRKRKTRGTRVVRLYQPVPNRALVKFNYVHNFVQPLNAGTPLQYFYQSSLFDPDFTAAGHQPLWHDQYALLYRKYRVHGIRYHITMSNRGETSNNVVWVGILHAPQTYQATTNIDTEFERRLCRHKGMLRHATGAMSSFSAKGYLSVPRTESISRQEFGGHEDYEANFGSNPAKTSKLIIMYNSLANEQVHGIVRLTFYAQVFDPLQPNGS